ncbi:DUF1659 domain-containing protein [Atopobacter sp. AH10]|uniref:DUF1659 domain-containing protein n=1 Tax=Atopobacter sp. AH10 TaxID=2315861 RepID=UPI000EF1D8A6|nr:DUF1659 domain-containing protein [Atopobacter sp. AH10]RLK64269.1 DUF1659 domain-containing protein [Atopobacter sp. AH10]
MKTYKNGKLSVELSKDKSKGITQQVKDIKLTASDQDLYAVAEAIGTLSALPLKNVILHQYYAIEKA